MNEGKEKLHQFLNYWDKLAKDGEVSYFTGSETLALIAFVDWLDSVKTI